MRTSAQKKAVPLLLVLILIFDFFAMESAEAGRRRKVRSGGLHSVKYDAKAAKGLCLASVRSSSEARGVLGRNRVKISTTARSSQMISAAIGVQQIELLAGRAGSFIQGAKFTFPKSRKHSRYLSDSKTIQMGRNHRDGNVAHLMHELGHHVGNAGLYGPYKRTVPTCHFTRYSKMVWSRGSARNEEFAEVFSAFVTNPDLLRKSRINGCRKAYKFFASHFPDAANFAVCDRAFLKKSIERMKQGGRMADLQDPQIISASHTYEDDSN